MKTNKRIQATNNSLSKEEKEIIKKIAFKTRPYGKIDLLMKVSGLGEVPKVYDELSFIEFQLTSNSTENLIKLESSFDNEIKEALGDKVIIR